MRGRRPMPPLPAQSCIGRYFGGQTTRNRRPLSLRQQGLHHESHVQSTLFPALALSAIGLSAPAALAAPPSNDTFTGATSATVGFGEVLDTTDATTDADDAQLNADCGAPATDASVWYVIEGADVGVAVDVSQSDYSAGVLVGVGTQETSRPSRAVPGTVAFFAEAGTTYYVLAFDDQEDGARQRRTP